MLTVLLWMSITLVAAASVAGWPRLPGELGGGPPAAAALLLTGVGVAWCAWLTVAVWHERRRRRQLMWDNPAALVPTIDRPHVPSIGAEALSVAMALLAAFVLLAPLAAGPPLVGWANIVLFLATMLCSTAAFAQAFRRWSPAAGCGGLALTTLGVAALVQFLSPASGGSTADAVLGHSAAIVLSLALMIWFWTWLAAVWEQQLDGGRAWTTAGRLRGLIAPFTIGSAAVAAAAGLVSAARVVWLEDRPAPVSTGTLIYAIAANLLLLSAVVRLPTRRPAALALGAAVILNVTILVVARATDILPTR